MSLLDRTTCRLYTRRPLLALASFSSLRSTTTYLLRVQRVQRSYATQEPPTTPGKTRRENIYTLPNFLTVTRIAACPVLGWSVVNGDFITATGLLAYSAITDWVRQATPYLIWFHPNLRSGGWLAGAKVQYANCSGHHLRSCGRQDSNDDAYGLTGL